MRNSPLPLWEKVAVGGLRPPFFNRTPMLCIGHAKSVPDEGLRSIDSPKPLTRREFAALIRATLSHKGSEEFLITAFSLLLSIDCRGRLLTYCCRLHIGSR